jgi:hypothetical protein
MKNNFKTLLTVLLFCTLSHFSAYTQGIEITPFAGYTFADRMDFTNGGWGRITGGFTYGGTISKMIGQFNSVELLYSRQDATGEYDAFDYYTGSSIHGENIPLTVNYMQAGACRLVPLGPSGKAEGFAGIDLGAVVFSLKENYQDKWMFAAGIKLGVKIWANEKVGILLQSDLQVPAQSAGIGIFAGSGGVSTGVSTFTTITQFGFKGGLILRMGK